MKWNFYSRTYTQSIASDADRMSSIQPTEFKSTNVKLTAKHSSLTTMTIANRRCSFMSIFSLSPRHGQTNINSSNKSITFSTENSMVNHFINSILLALIQFSNQSLTHNFLTRRKTFWNTHFTIIKLNLSRTIWHFHIIM